MSDQYLEDCDNYDFGSDDGPPTPTSSNSEKPLTTPHVTYSIPCPGKTYKIYLRGTEKVMMVTEGKVVLLEPAKARLVGGWHWACVEKGNWLGFRNHVTGKFLGRTPGKRGLRAQASSHGANESFTLRHHPDGGYLLLVNCKEVEELGQIHYSDVNKTFYDALNYGDRWVFEEV